LSAAIGLPVPTDRSDGRDAGLTRSQRAADNRARSEKSCRRDTAIAASDLLGLRCWREDPSSPPFEHDGIEVDLLEASHLETYLHFNNVVRIRPVRVVVFWAAFPHQPPTDDTVGVLHRLVIPRDLFLARDLPGPLVGALLAGRRLAAEITTRIVIVNKFQQWEKDVAGGDLEMRHAALLEIDAWLRRVGPGLVSERGGVADRTDTQRRISESAATMCQYIIENFRDSVQVADVARAASTNPQHAMAIFREAIGCTIVDYLTRCRVGEAQRLLISTDATTSDVAFASGFGSVSQFYERFASTCDLTPRQYRLEQRAR
jgi:AraC family transcriptional regulator, melibiose operon regulatory protein